jgi:hypothetical protein
MKTFERDLPATSELFSKRLHCNPCLGHIQNGRSLRSSISGAKIANSEVFSIMGPDCRNADGKNEKDWPPIHSREQSLQIIVLNERGLNSDI